MTKRWAVDSTCGRTFYIYSETAQEAVRRAKEVGPRVVDHTPAPTPPFVAREPDERDAGKYQDDNRRAPGA